MKPLLLLAAAVMLSSCADEDDTIPITNSGAMLPPRLVGRIATVPSDKRFVLIQSYGKWSISSGTVLVTRGTGDRTANLLVTGEAMDQYAAADVQSGEVAPGDAVYARGTNVPPSGPVAVDPSIPNLSDLPKAPAP